MNYQLSKSSGESAWTVTFTSSTSKYCAFLLGCWWFFVVAVLFFVFCFFFLEQGVPCLGVFPFRKCHSGLTEVCLHFVSTRAILGWHGPVKDGTFSCDGWILQMKSWLWCIAFKNVLCIILFIYRYVTLLVLTGQVHATCAACLVVTSSPLWGQEMLTDGSWSVLSWACISVHADTCLWPVWMWWK